MLQHAWKCHGNTMTTQNTRRGLGMQITVLALLKVVYMSLPYVNYSE